MNKYALWLTIFGIVLGLGGLVILVMEAPFIALGVFLCIWGNNVTNRDMSSEHP